MKTDESTADRGKERRRLARSAFTLGPSMCWRGSARFMSPEARTKVVGLEEVELVLGGRRWGLSRPCGQADVIEDSLDDQRCGDQGDEPKGRVAPRTSQHLRTPDPFRQLRPSVIARRSSLGVLIEHLDVEERQFVCSLAVSRAGPAIGDDLVPVLGSGREAAVVNEEVFLRPRHQGRQPFEQFVGRGRLRFWR